MNNVEAREAVQTGQVVIARYKLGGGEHARGKVVAYCEEPSVVIESADGTRFSWRADMVVADESEIVWLRKRVEYLEQMARDLGGMD